MTPAYIKSVKGKFEAMRNSGELVPALVNPTRASIRDECLRLYPTRFAQKDKDTLVDFFEHDKADGTLLETIERVDLEDLKALQNFICGETAKPNYRVVEMMAWLIDFEPRPYSAKVDYSKIASDLPVPKQAPNLKNVGEPKSTGLPEPGEDTKTPNVEFCNPEKPEWRRLIITLVVLVVIAGLIVFAILKSGKKSDECMYWAGDHYEPTSCIQRGGDTTVVPMDANRLRNFRRIKDTNTITENSIGKVWYRIKEREFEFYTSHGKHPIDIQINVRKLTKESYAKFQQTR